jgi:hypothetical protein
VLGVASFITMGTTRRYQAVHDLLTHSTVQIRDATKASEHHYSSEQTELSSPNMPSYLRRLIVVGLYLIAAYLVFLVVVAGLEASGALSRACVYQERCSTIEKLLLYGMSIAWFVASVACIVLGWRGRLIGARRARTGSPS